MKSGRDEHPRGVRRERGGARSKLDAVNCLVRTKFSCGRGTHVVPCTREASAGGLCASGTFEATTRRAVVGVGG